MDTSAAVRLFTRLTREQQIRFLCWFGHSLTMDARDTYVYGSYEVHAPQRLRAINEKQHRVFGHILNLLDDDERRYPDDVIVGIMLETDDERLRAQAARSFVDAMKRVGHIPTNDPMCSESTDQGGPN